VRPNHRLLFSLPFFSFASTQQSRIKFSFTPLRPLPPRILTVFVIGSKFHKPPAPAFGPAACTLQLRFESFQIPFFPTPPPLNVAVASCRTLYPSITFFHYFFQFPTNLDISSPSRVLLYQHLVPPVLLSLFFSLLADFSHPHVHISCPSMVDLFSLPPPPLCLDSLFRHPPPPAPGLLPVQREPCSHSPRIPKPLATVPLIPNHGVQFFFFFYFRLATSCHSREGSFTVGSPSLAFTGTCGESFLRPRYISTPLIILFSLLYYPSPPVSDLNTSFYLSYKKNFRLSIPDTPRFTQGTNFPNNPP